MTGMRPVGYRLSLSNFARARRVVVYIALAVLFSPGLLDPSSQPLVRLGSAGGILLAMYGLRMVAGPMVVVRESGLRVYSWWPRHRDLAWYRVFAVDVLPGQWQLELELNSGERVLLPPVERVDDLYDQIEDLRQRLDA
jgi:hypothetical protein